MVKHRDSWLQTDLGKAGEDKYKEVFLHNSLHSGPDKFVEADDKYKAGCHGNLWLKDPDK